MEKPLRSSCGMEVGVAKDGNEVERKRRRMMFVKRR